MPRKGVAFHALVCYHFLMNSTVEHVSTEDVHAFRKKILDWYDKHRRVLPWRALKGEEPVPYHVWLSEIMLQQTTVQAVIPYFLKFVKKWPDVHVLANADNEAIMSYWAGLGYYARARNLHKCAKVVSDEYDGQFPSDQKELQSLPGIGDYTSAAIRSIAFNKPSVVVDGNIERVMARYHAVSDALPKGKKVLKAYAAAYSEGVEDRPGDYAQALMDIGATVCTPKSPSCAFCPVNDDCRAYGLGTAEAFPVKAAKKAKPKRYGYVYIVKQDDKILLQKREERGLLGGMFGLPTSDWVDDKAEQHHLDVLGETNIPESTVAVYHVFTHFELELNVVEITVSNDFCYDESYSWFSLASVDQIGFPTVFKKAYDLRSK